MRKISNEHEGSKNQEKADAQSLDTAIADPTNGENGTRTISQELPNPDEVSSKEDEGVQDGTNQQNTEYGTEEVYCDIETSEEEGQPCDMKRLIKGKYHVASDLQIQSPGPKHKPSHKKRREMKRKGINTIQHTTDIDSTATLPKEQPQSPSMISGFEADGPCKAEGYRK